MITLKDIAKLSGYSVTTVSRALNDHSDVNMETKKHIQQIAKKHGYAPNVLARGLVEKNSKTFGFITTGISKSSPIDTFTFTLFMSSIKKANSIGYDLIMINYENDLHKNKNFHQLIAERNLSGAIIQGFDKNHPLCQEALDSALPTVFIDIGLENTTSGYVVSDIAKAADIGLSYLAHCGYQRILFFRGSDNSWITEHWKLGIQSAYTKYQSYFSSLQVLNGNYLINDVKEMIIGNPVLIEKNKTAIFCASDAMAIGALEGLRVLGIKVPEEIGLLGYDGAVISQYVTPKLTTIAQHPDEIGSKAVLLLLDLLQNQSSKKEHHVIDIDVTLQVRESTKEYIKSND